MNSPSGQHESLATVLLERDDQIWIALREGN